MLTKITMEMPIEAKFLTAFVTITALYFHSKFTPANANKAPALLTTIGILGTFLGIALGLLEFDTDNIQQSVPDLIKGIKTAFWVSTVGIFWAITIKLREAYATNKHKLTKNKYNGATINDLVEILNNVKNALVGDEEATLLSQIKLSRQDSNDKISKLGGSLDAFCEKIADNNSKALIDALKEVIKDFNTKINEQFGENFKHLNQAVGQTLEWQKQYRDQITEIIEQQTKTSNSLSIVANSMSIATDKYHTLLNQADIFNSITSTLSKNLTLLSESILAIETQRHQIDASIRSLANVINTATTGLPKIEENISSITMQLSNSVKATGDELNNSLIKSIKNSTQGLEKEINQITSELGNKILESNNELKKLMLNTIQITNQEVNDNLQKVNHEVQSNITVLIENTKEQVIVLDKALSTELTKSLEIFGRQLASLSQKFAEDYTPLTAKLRDIVELARTT
jgi:DNA anti-recombination protein RmuC